MNIKLPVALFIGLVFWVGIFVALTSKVWGSEGDILIADNFNDGKLDGWTIQYGNWYVNPQGNLAGSNSGKMLGGRINTNNSEWDNYRINLGINGFQGIDGYVGFRYLSNSNFYELNLRFGTGSNNTPEAILRKTENGVVTTIGDTHSLSLNQNWWYHLIIEVSNENIKISIDNNLIFNITDIGTQVKKGTLSLGYWTGDIGQAYMKFDNVVVTALAPPPPPRLPVVFIPGIGGSEMKATQDIYWSKDDGHGGNYSHGYSGGEKIWVNQEKAAELGNDDYFDVLRLKTDGQTSEAALSLTGDLTAFGYSDIDSFFTGMGYTKGTNFFVFPYDWRKDVRTTKDSLDSLIETAKQKSGQSKINLVVHSMGGLVARYYISDSGKAAKVNKLIELGVPHLGAVNGLKAMMYGKPLGRQILGDFYLGIPASEVKDIFQNLPSAFQLLPSTKYFSFYDNSDKDHPYPFRDDRDIDNNNLTGSLTYSQTKDLLTNLSYNMAVFSVAEQFHNSLDSILNQTNGVSIYEIAGSSQPTLGQIQETWWITWPINLLLKRDETFINGDNTVPLYSASLKSDSQDLSGATKIYYVEQKHSDLVSSNGTAMQTVKSILNDDNAVPVEVKDQKISLEGQQVSLDDGKLDLYDDQNRHCGEKDNGEIEENIPDVTCTSSGNTKHAFVKKKAGKVTVKVTRKNPTVASKTTNLKIRTYKQDTISKTTIYKDLPVSQTGKVEFILDPTIDTAPSLILYPDSEKDDNVIIAPTAEAEGSAALDQTPPKTTIQISGAKNDSGIYTGPVIITLTDNDAGSGILRIEYSLDNGQTVQIYKEPFTISDPGKTTIQIKAIDKSGNEEIPQSITIEIAVQPTPTPTQTTSGVGSDSPEVNSTTTSGSTTPGVNQDTASNTPSVSSVANTSEVSSTASSPVIARSETTWQSSMVVEDSSLIAQNDNENILGISFKNPSHISDQINTSNILSQQKTLSNETNPATQFLGGLLIVSGGIITLASLGLIITFGPWNLLRSKTNEVSFFRRHTSFVKPFPK